MKFLVVISLIYLFNSGQCQVNFVEHRMPQLTAVFEAHPYSEEDDHSKALNILQNQPSGSDEESTESGEIIVQQPQQNSGEEDNNISDVLNENLEEVMKNHIKTNDIDHRSVESPDQPIVITYVEQEILISPKSLNRIFDSFLGRPAVHFMRRSDLSDLPELDFNVVPNSSKDQFNTYNSFADYIAKFMNEFNSIQERNLKTPLPQMNDKVLLEYNLPKEFTENEQAKDAPDLSTMTDNDNDDNEIDNRDIKFVLDLPNEELPANDDVSIVLANKIENGPTESGIEESTEAPSKEVMKPEILFRENLA